MNNMYDSPAGAGSGDLGSLGDAGDPAGSYGSHGGFPSARTRKKRMFRWGAGITLAGFLAGGLIALALSGSSAPAASPASTVSGSGQVQGTALNSALSTASSTTAVPLGRIRWALARLRALGGVHGEFTFYNKTGFHTLAFERGTIQSVNGTDVVISAPDGTVWTWLIVSNTVVRESGSKTTTNALATGELVFAGRIAARNSTLSAAHPGTLSDRQTGLTYTCARRVAPALAVAFHPTTAKPTAVVL